MRPVSVLIEELRETRPDRAEKAMQWMRLVLPRLPALIAFVLVAFSAGWIGGRWAAWPSPQKETSPAPRDTAAAATINQATKLPAPYEEAAPIPPKDTPASQEEGNSEGRAYLGIRGKEFHRGEGRGAKISEVFPDSPAAQPGLRPIQRPPRLQEGARRHCEDRASRRFFGHLSPDGQDVVDRLRAEGIADFTAAGENLFSGKQVAGPMQLAVVREWLKTPSHSKNLLSPRYTEGGVGIARAEKEQIYVTQVYLER